MRRRARESLAFRCTEAQRKKMQADEEDMLAELSNLEQRMIEASEREDVDAYHAAMKAARRQSMAMRAARASMFGLLEENEEAAAEEEDAAVAEDVSVEAAAAALDEEECVSTLDEIAEGEEDEDAEDEEDDEEE